MIGDPDASVASATSVVFKDLWLEDKDKDKYLRSKDKDKDKDFPRGQQHWVIVKNGLLAEW